MNDARDFDPDEKWWREYLGVNELEAEIARLRALLTAPPDDAERSAAKTNLIDPLAAAFAVRARKIGNNE